MERKYALLIVVGLGFGVMFGMSFGVALENMPLGIAFGAFGGVFVGWFAAAALQERSGTDNTKNR